MAKRKRRPIDTPDDPYRGRVQDFGNCESCEQPLGIEGGMGGLGMCGPCVTGEAETIDECGETW